MIFCSEYTQWKKKYFRRFYGQRNRTNPWPPTEVSLSSPWYFQMYIQKIAQVVPIAICFDWVSAPASFMITKISSFLQLYLQLRQFFPPAKQTSGRSEVCWSSPCSPCTLWRPWPCTSCTSHPATAWRPMRSWWFGSSELRVERFATRCWWCCAAFRGPGSIPRWAMVCWISYIIGTLW